VGTALIVVATMLAVRRCVAPPGGFVEDTVPPASVFGVLGVAFAVLLAFVVFLASRATCERWRDRHARPSR
jgi:hypothetical protein